MHFAEKSCRLPHYVFLNTVYILIFIKENILKAANGKFPAAAPEFPEYSADEVYARYLALLNLNYAGFAGKIIRHKI